MDAFRFRHAISRRPGSRFADGLTRVDLGPPDLALALAQHARYVETLAAAGVAVDVLPADAHPDSTFVEDTAVLVPGLAVLTRPGAPTRAAEVAAIEPVVAARFGRVARIEAPGTVDGGDVCWAGTRFFVGLSARTNAEGIRQLAAHLAPLGYETIAVDMRDVGSILHLKSGLAALDERRLVVIDALAGHPAFADAERIRVDPDEEYAANCIRVNDVVVLADGFPKLAARLAALGYAVRPVGMSEFAKLDGGPSCLSLRF